MRQSIVKNTVHVTPQPPPPAPHSALARAGAFALLGEPARSPAGKVIELLALREQVDAELGRLMAAMGIPMPAVNATSPTPEPVAAAPVAPAEDLEPAAPRVKRACKRREASEPPPAAKSGKAARGAPLACDEFAGQVFTHQEARDLAGLAAGVPMSAYAKKGMRAGGKHVFRFATAAEIAAAGGNVRVAAPPPPPARKPDPPEDPDVDDPVEDVEEEKAAPAAGGGRTRWECLACFTHIDLSRPPGKCGRCGAKKFRVAPGQPAVA